MSETERLQRLERVVAALAQDVQQLREDVARLRGDAAPAAAVTVAVVETTVVTAAPPPPLPPRPTEEQRRGSERRTAPRRAIDLEALIGRYGTLALAALTILMGVGAFLGWAIANGKIGPTMRVALGAVAAAAVGVFGWRLRRKGAATFGNVLLALALAVVHVDAWGAGPYLHVVPAPVALGIAALASIALAWFAYREREQALFSVGVGGAMLAPFVTSDARGSADALLAYGIVVLSSGMATLRERPWRVPALLLALGCWLYTGAAVDLLAPNAALPHAVYPALFALVSAWLALLFITGPERTQVAQAALAALLTTLFAGPLGGRKMYAPEIIPLAALGTLTALATLQLDREQRVGALRAVLGAVILPLGFLAAAVGVLPAGANGIVALTATVWAAASAAAAWRLGDQWRGAHAVAAGLASAAAAVAIVDTKPVPTIVALSVHAIALTLVARRFGIGAALFPAALDLIAAALWAFVLLDERAAYQYTPFLTTRSLAAGAAAIGWLVFSWHASRMSAGTAGPPSEWRALMRLPGIAVTFLWIRAELAEAYSVDIATFLLILYYAIAGVATIFIGRLRGIPLLRHVGLALAIYAALKAVVQASELAIGLRVGSYLLAGAFLLAVAYWYRVRGESQAATSETPPASSELSADG
jgi:hypothetical protein